MNTFANTAFTDAEFKLIVPNVDETTGLEDKLFLLSEQEFVKYTDDNQDSEMKRKIRKCTPTVHARNYGADYYANVQSGWWWLRTTNNVRASIVSISGKLDQEFKDKKGGGVRPAMWISLDQD